MTYVNQQSQHHDDEDDGADTADDHGGAVSVVQRGEVTLRGLFPHTAWKQYTTRDKTMYM